MKIKEKLAEETIYELKWKHFFVELDPLNLNLNQKARRQIAAFILKGLFETATLMPLVSVVRKDKTAGDLVIRTKSGGNKLDENSFWLSTLALFGLFLDRKNAKGRIVFDSLNPSQEKERQDIWSEQLRGITQNNLPEGVFKNLKKLLLIEEKITFANSSNSNLIQIADFFCGIVWRAAEGDEELFSAFHSEFGEKAEREGLGLIHLL